MSQIKQVFSWLFIEQTTYSSFILKSKMPQFTVFWNYYVVIKIQNDRLSINENVLLSKI
jgi:hypothetical protein